MNMLDEKTHRCMTVETGIECRQKRRKASERAQRGRRTRIRRRSIKMMRNAN